jgi:hypothetical protein
VRPSRCPSLAEVYARHSIASWCTGPTGPKSGRARRLPMSTCSGKTAKLCEERQERTRMEATRRLYRRFRLICPCWIR